MEMAGVPRRRSHMCVLSRGDGVERKKIDEDSQASSAMAKSDGEKGAGSKIPRLAHRPPRSHRPSSVTSSSSTDTDHSALKDEVTKLTKVKSKLNTTLLLNAACLFANSIKHDGKPSPVFAATDSTMHLLTLKQKNRTKSDSCVNAARQGRKSLGHNRVKSDTDAIKTSKRHKTPRTSSEIASDLSSTSSDSSKIRDLILPSSSETSDPGVLSRHTLKKCRSSFGKDGDDEETDDSTVVGSPTSFLEIRKSMNVDFLKNNTHSQKESQETVSNVDTNRSDVATQECMLDIGEGEIPKGKLSSQSVSACAADTVSARKVQKVPSHEHKSRDSLKRSFSSVDTNAKSAPSSNINVASGASSEDYYSCQSYCSIEPGTSPSKRTTQDIANATRHELKLGSNRQAINPGEHRLRSMQLQSRIADMIKIGKSWLQPPSKDGKNCLNGKWHRADGSCNAPEDKEDACRLSKSESSVIGSNVLELDSLKPNPLPRTIYFCKKGESGGHLTYTSEDSRDEWQEKKHDQDGTGAKLATEQQPSNLVSAHFVDGPEIIPNKKLTREELEQQTLQLDVVDRNTVGIQVNLFSISEFQTRFGVDIGVQVNEIDLELDTAAAAFGQSAERSGSFISLKSKKSKLSYQPLGSVSDETNKLIPLLLNENEKNNSDLKIDLSGLTRRESATQISLEEKRSKTNQLSLNGLNNVKTPGIAVVTNKFKATRINLKEKHSEKAPLALECEQFSPIQTHPEEIPFQSTQPSEDEGSRSVEIPIDWTSEQNINNFHLREVTVDVDLPIIQENLIQKNFQIDLTPMEMEDFSPKGEAIFPEDVNSPIEVIHLPAKIETSPAEKVHLLAKTETSVKANQSFRIKKTAHQSSPKPSPKAVTKQPQKTLTPFTNFRKTKKLDESAKTRGSHAQAKSEPAVAAKKEPYPNTTKSDQGMRNPSHTNIAGKKTPKFVRRIPVPYKNKSGVTEKKVAVCTTTNRLSAGIDKADEKNPTTCAIITNVKLISDRLKLDNSMEQKGKSSRIPRQDMANVLKPKLPGNSRDTRCVSCRATDVECTHTGQFRSSASSKANKSKTFSTP